MLDTRDIAQCMKLVARNNIQIYTLVAIYIKYFKAENQLTNQD